jgi:hypothetical protein
VDWKFCPASWVERRSLVAAQRKCGPIGKLRSITRIAVHGVLGPPQLVNVEGIP